MGLGIGITGGVATGKSTVANRLFELLQLSAPVDLFSSDFEARRLTDSDFVVQEEIKAAFGVQVFDSEGNLARDRLRELVFHDAAARKTLEAILHPRIREAWISRTRGDRLLLAEIPLLYETGAEPYFDRIIVTACSRASQVERMVVERRLLKELAEQIIQAQMDLEEKIRRADWVVWTDCSPQITAQQVNLISQEVIERYGGARR
jgi:dephospho-CoA kinase